MKLDEVELETPTETPFKPLNALQKAILSAQVRMVQAWLEKGYNRLDKSGIHRSTVELPDGRVVQAFINYDAF